MQQLELSITDYPPFDGLDDAFVKKHLGAASKYTRMPALYFLSEINEPVKQIGCVCSGRIDLFAEDNHRQFIKKGEIAEKDFFGLEILFGNGLSFFNALVTEPVNCFVIDKQVFLDILQKDPELKTYFKTVLLKRLQQAINNPSLWVTSDGPDVRPFKSKKLERAILYIENHYTRNITLDDLAEVNCLSRYYLSRKFKEETGYSFKDYLNIRRLKAAQKLLAIPDVNISETCFSVGFNDVSYFSRVFKKYVGVSPSNFKKGVKKAKPFSLKEQGLDNGYHPDYQNHDGTENREALNPSPG